MTSSSTSTKTPPCGDAKETPVDDDLDFARVLQIFLRTWPFIKPLSRHLIFFVLCSMLVFLFSTTLGFIVTGLINSGIIGGQPLGLLHAGIYGLDPAVFVDVEELSADARRQKFDSFPGGRLGNSQGLRNQLRSMLGALLLPPSPCPGRLSPADGTARPTC